ncbi:hypothetical protein sS8_0583 [Methylocaldum marinum]|uniref:Uncharacterized protein n=1 Tax=Methylocaldum marinum TaxID=1432792 RepID=A0A250KLW3_9GAMM|nr:hypothetical protein [Methylocaldum marinum]BBA32548.1 hypothetical protein sS8_0583 [Methylocaldum marinum]
MNKWLLLFTVLALTGMISRLGLLNTDEPAHASRSSAPLHTHAHGEKPKFSPPQVRTAIAPPEDGFDVPTTKFHAIADRAVPVAGIASSRTERRPVEIPGTLVPEDLEWLETTAENDVPGADAMSWEDPYGGKWRDQGGG